jgi:hypothetical protein
MPKVQLRPQNAPEGAGICTGPVAITFYMMLLDNAKPFVAERFTSKSCIHKSRATGILQAKYKNLIIYLLVEAKTERALESLLTHLIESSYGNTNLNYYGLIYIPAGAEISFAADEEIVSPSLVDVVRFDNYTISTLNLDFFAQHFEILNQYWQRHIEVSPVRIEGEASVVIPVFHLNKFQLPPLILNASATKVARYADKFIIKMQRLMFMLSGAFALSAFNVVLGAIAFFFFGIILLSRVGQVTRLALRSSAHKSKHEARFQALAEFHHIGLNSEIPCNFGTTIFCRNLAYRIFYIFMYSRILNDVLYPFAYLLIGFSYAKGLGMLTDNFVATCVTSVAFMLSRYVLYLSGRPWCIKPNNWLKVLLQITGVTAFAGSTAATYTIGSFSSINYIDWLLQNYTGDWCNRTNPFVNNSNPWTVRGAEVLLPTFIQDGDQGSYLAGLSVILALVLLQFSILKNRNLPNNTDLFSSEKDFPEVVGRCGKIAGIMMLLPDLAVHGVIYGLNTVFMLTSVLKIINTYIASDTFTEYMLLWMVPIVASLIATVNFISLQIKAWRPEKYGWRIAFSNLGLGAIAETKKHVLVVATELYAESISANGRLVNYMATAQDLYAWFGSGTYHERHAVLRILHQYSIYHSDPRRLGNLLSILQITHAMPLSELVIFHGLCQKPVYNKARREDDLITHRNRLLTFPPHGRDDSAASPFSTYRQM